MTFTIAVFVTRKPGLTPSDFRNHWENKHIPLLQRLGGSLFPLNHSRHYLAREETVDGDGGYCDFPVTPLVGESADFTYDGFAVVTFASESAFRGFLSVMISDEVQEDEERFTDREKMRAVVLGEVRVTPGEG
ncbi:EthD domain-containing protein [Aspergillus lucknowensis]|uniref:EthD domain-containing protein n=1 Tax=Aspergillus lucknowensis TaxID=176173 RepID=A0ABR4LSL8_9EURO